jgi:hypothetical protein
MIRPFKTLKRIITTFLMLIIIGGVILYFTLNGIVRKSIARGATDSLNLQTDVGGVAINILKGSFGISDLKIASPSGFTAPHMLTLAQSGVGVTYSQLRKQPIHIDALAINKPQFVVEQANGKFNFQVLTDRPDEPRPSSSEPIKLIIDKLTVKDASVIIRPGIPGLDVSMKEIVVPLPELELRNIGNADGNQNGAAMRDVVLVLVDALVSKAQQSGNLPQQLQTALSDGIKQVENQIRNEVGKQLKGLDKTLKDVGLPEIGIGSDIAKSLGRDRQTKSKEDEKMKSPSRP